MFRHLSCLRTRLSLSNSAQVIRSGHELCRISPLLTRSTNNKDIFTSNSLVTRMFNQDMTKGWPQPIVDFLQRENFTEPTLIQAQTLPKTMEKRDMVGIARTGSGKTLAFVIPAIMHILEKREPEVGRQSKRDITCLVLAPTRELANQTATVVEKFATINSQILVGGQSRLTQINNLRRMNTDIVIATPGRLIDLVEDKQIDLSKVSYLVLDEADRMLDMGFEPQIRSIIKNLPEERQTLMWSATWPKEIKNLAEDFMREYDHIAIDGTELKANPNIEQIVEVCQGHEKFDIMLEYIRKFEAENSAEKPKILIFAGTQRMVDQLEFQLNKNSIRAISMHGRRTQMQRDRALESFRTNRCRVMVATDVAARGLDISDITHVFNYDFPNTIEDYIHRIGRTARHLNHGKSITLITNDDFNMLDDLIKVLKETNQEIPAELNNLAQQKHLHGSQKSNKRQYQNRQYSGRQNSYGQYQNRQYQNRNYQNRQYQDRQHQDRQYQDRQYQDRQYQDRQFQDRQFQ